MRFEVNSVSRTNNNRILHRYIIQRVFCIVKVAKTDRNTDSMTSGAVHISDKDVRSVSDGNAIVLVDNLAIFDDEVCCSRNIKTVRIVSCEVVLKETLLNVIECLQKNVSVFFYKPNYSLSCK